MSNETQDIKITGEPTMDPMVCKFHISRPLYPEGSVDCRDDETAKGSVLLENLFGIEGICEVLVYGSTVTLAKKENTPSWPELGKQIGAAIRGAVNSGKPLISEELKSREPSEEDLKKKVEQVMEEEINPYVHSHGGHIAVVDVKGSTLYVELSGGCQGCASAKVTLKQGIEGIVLNRVPQLTEVVDVTDHTAGVDPYYS